MQDLYHKYYLDNAAILKIMNEGILVFDSSALLDVSDMIISPQAASFVCP